MRRDGVGYVGNAAERPVIRRGEDVDLAGERVASFAGSAGGGRRVNVASSAAVAPRVSMAARKLWTCAAVGAKSGAVGMRVWV
jgi:hypothetical protein